MSTETSKRDVQTEEVLASPEWQEGLRQLLKAADRLVHQADEDGRLMLSDLQRPIVPIDRLRWPDEQR